LPLRKGNLPRKKKYREEIKGTTSQSTTKKNKEQLIAKEKAQDLFPIGGHTMREE